MEILSIGDKIRRARVYKGITLKDLCEDKISISKMSCIENNKIMAEEEIVSHISKKLNVDYEYLAKDVRTQIEENIIYIDKNILEKKELLKYLEYNIRYSVKEKYYDLAFNLIHRLFRLYIKSNDTENIEAILSQYYRLYCKNISDESKVIYYSDMGDFFKEIGEFSEAINYYGNVKMLLEKYRNNKCEEYIYNCFNEGICHLKLGDKLSAYNELNTAINNIDKVKSDSKKSEIYIEFSKLSILLDKEGIDVYIKKTYHSLRDKQIDLIRAKVRIGESYYRVGQGEKGRKEILDAISVLVDKTSEEYIEILIEALEAFYNNGEYEIGTKLSEELLNLSISSDNVKLVERAYYFKGMILQKVGLHRQAEMYMNISTDYYLKYSKKEGTYNRYNQMGELYYNLGETREAIKYFTLAMGLKKE